MSCVAAARTAGIKTSELCDVLAGSGGPATTAAYFLSGWADWETFFIVFTPFVNKLIIPRSERSMVNICCSVS